MRHLDLSHLLPKFMSHVEKKSYCLLKLIKVSFLTSTRDNASTIGIWLVNSSVMPVIWVAILYSGGSNEVSLKSNK